MDLGYRTTTSSHWLGSTDPVISHSIHVVEVLLLEWLISYSSNVEQKTSHGFRRPILSMGLVYVPTFG